MAGKLTKAERKLLAFLASEAGPAAGYGKDWDLSSFHHSQIPMAQRLKASGLLGGNWRTIRITPAGRAALEAEHGR